MFEKMGSLGILSEEMIIKYKKHVENLILKNNEDIYDEDEEDGEEESEKTEEHKIEI
jgi:hypothetical protein